MPGKRIGFDDEVSHTMAKTAEDAGHHNPVAREKFADGTNTTARHQTKHPSFGSTGHVNRGGGKKSP